MSSSPQMESLMAEGSTVKVYGVGIRFWHWLMAIAIFVLLITGYFIGVPLYSPSGEASDWYIMGYIRFIHFTAGYVLAILFVWRVYLAIIGTKIERELFTLPILKPAYYKEIINQSLYYGLITKSTNKHLGHNALARTVYFIQVVLGTIYMVFSGFALYGEGTQTGSWAHTAFSWVLTLHGDSLSVHIGHRLVAWTFVFFILAHIYMVIYNEITARSTCISAMFSGSKVFRT